MIFLTVVLLISLRLHHVAARLRSIQSECTFLRFLPPLPQLRPAVAVLFYTRLHLLGFGGFINLSTNAPFAGFVPAGFRTLLNFVAELLFFLRDKRIIVPGKHLVVH
jgi:hypothetical protein